MIEPQNYVGLFQRADPRIPVLSEKILMSQDETCNIYIEKYAHKILAGP
jgi:hypothetical protein